MLTYFSFNIEDLKNTVEDKLKKLAEDAIAAALKKAQTVDAAALKKAEADAADVAAKKGSMKAAAVCNCCFR